MRLVGVEQAVADLSAALEREMEAGMLRGARLVADQAAAVHPYTNRTFQLQRRTVAGRVSGSLHVGRWRAEVFGDTPYGSFVEEGTSRARAYAFLGPAWVARAEDVARVLEDSMRRAVSAAGWAP